MKKVSKEYIILARKQHLTGISALKQNLLLLQVTDDISFQKNI